MSKQHRDAVQIHRARYIQNTDPVYVGMVSGIEWVDTSTDPAVTKVSDGAGGWTVLMDPGDFAAAVDMTAAEADILALQSDVTDLTTADTALDGRLDTLEGQNLDSRVTTLEGAGYATEAYADSAAAAAVAAVVNSAPSALDTLNELASALGDDANFATTVTTSLAAKASSAALATEVSDRTAADTTLQNEIDAVSGGTAGAHGEGMKFDAGASYLSAGLKDSYRLQRGGTITSWTITGDGVGSATFAIRTSSYAGFPGSLASIVAAAPPTLTAARNATSAVLTGWTVALTKGDYIEIELLTVSGLKNVKLQLAVV